MQVTETLSDGLKRGYTVVVPAADIESRRTKRLAEIGKTLRLPGFRPGKVPMPVVKQRYGTAISAEVLEESVNDATRQMLSDRGLRSASQPKVDVVSIEDAKDLEFKVEVELLPEIVMPNFSEIALTRLKAEPPVETIDTALHEIASRQKNFVEDTEIRPAGHGDVLEVDFVGRVDGVEFAGGSATDIDVELGGSGFIPGFAEQLDGMSPGEERTISVTFPADYTAKELAGKDATFDVKAKVLKKAELPAIDDALAVKLGVGDLEALRKILASQVQREYDQISRMKLKRQLLDVLAGLTSFPVPQSMADAEFDQIWQRVEADRKEGKVDDDDAGKDDDTLKAEYRGIAERRVRLGLLLAEIGRVNGIVVAPDEMQRAMRTEASRYRGQEQQVMEFFRKNPQAAESLRGPIFEEKVVDYIVELANVTDKPVTPEELAAEDPTTPSAPALAAPASEADHHDGGHDARENAGQTAGAPA